MATRTFGGTVGNWNDSSKWVEGAVPTDADEVVFDIGSANCTITANAVCRSIDTNGYTGTLTHNASVSLTIGDGTAPGSGYALIFGTGFTYTKGSATTSSISFVSTSATQQLIQTSGRTLGDVTFNASSNGSWKFAGSLTAGLLTLTKGSLDLDGYSYTLTGFSSSNSNVRSLTCGVANITVTGGGGWSCSTSTNFTLSAASASITVSGANAPFAGGGLTYGNVELTGSGQQTISGTNTFEVLTRTGTASKTDELVLQNDQTVNSTFSVVGNSAINRVLVRSSFLGTARTITCNGMIAIDGVDFRDITAAGSGFWDFSSVTNYSGDCGGNTGITFTTAASQTWSGTSGGNWSTNSWTSRVPLPQDDVVINAAFSASQTVTLDMPRAGKSITWSGATGNPAWAKTTSTTIYGSLTMISGMTNSGTTSFTFEGRGAFTLTSSGQTFTNSTTFAAFGGSVTLQDAFSCSSTSAITHSNGTLDANGVNVTATGLFTTNSNTRTLTIGSGTWTLTGTGTVLNATTSTNLTVTASTGTIAFTDTGSASKQFAGGGKTWPILSIATGGSGSVSLVGANTLKRIAVTGTSTKSIVFPGSTTTTLTDTTPFPSGTAGNLLTFTASSGSATVSCANTVSVDYVSLTNIIAAGAAIPFTAGSGSTNGGGNTNWTFSGGGGGSGASRNHMLLGVG